MMRGFDGARSYLVGKDYAELLEREAEAESIQRRIVAGAFDYDPPVERCALVTWAGDPPAWSIVMAASLKRVASLHEWGLLYFGPPPWRRSCVVSVVGRLAALEQHVAAMSPPAADFCFAFAVEPGSMPGELPLKGGVVPGRVQPDRVRSRAATMRQGVLF